MTDNAPEGTAVRNELQSFFGRINYGLKDRYLFTATIRADGSSKFGENNKYGTFPSFALGWRISEESFMESLPFSNLKLRAGWGQTGNQEIPSKITQALFTTSVSGSTSYPLYPTGTIQQDHLCSVGKSGYSMGSLYPNKYGLDFGFLDGALYGTIDYFNRSPINLLRLFPGSIQPATTYGQTSKT